LFPEKRKNIFSTPTCEFKVASSGIGRFLQIRKGRFALLDEGGHALLLVLERKRLVEEPLLKVNALAQRHLERGVDALLGHGDCRNGEWNGMRDRGSFGTDVETKKGRGKTSSK
jgi:hypothetical protein